MVKIRIFEATEGLGQKTRSIPFGFLFSSLFCQRGEPYPKRWWPQFVGRKFDKKTIQQSNKTLQQQKLEI